MRVLVLCFALGTLAYAGHTHAPTRALDTHYSCEFCTGFGGLIDAPAASIATVDVPTRSEPIVAAVIYLANRPVGVAQARAPPAR